MVDIFALALSHGLLALAAWRLLWRPELDDESPGGPVRRKARVMHTGKADPGAQEQEAGDA